MEERAPSPAPSRSDAGLRAERPRADSRELAPRRPQPLVTTHGTRRRHPHLRQPAFLLQIHRQADLRLRGPGTPAQQIAGPLVADRAGHRRHHRFRNFHPHRHRGRRRILPGSVPPARAGARRNHQFRAHRQHRGSAHARPPARRTVDCDFVLAGSDRLQLRRIVLRRAGLDDPHRRQRLHLLLRHARRNFRLDHRLGPHPRIRGLERRGRGRLCRIYESATGGLRPQPAGQMGEPGLGRGSNGRAPISISPASSSFSFSRCCWCAE